MRSQRAHRGNFSGPPRERRTRVADVSQITTPDARTLHRTRCLSASAHDHRGIIRSPRRGSAVREDARRVSRRRSLPPVVAAAQPAAEPVPPRPARHGDASGSTAASTRPPGQRRRRPPTSARRSPDEGEPATEPTEVSVLYDDRNLYVGVRAHDREPDQVIARILQRDAIIRSSMDGRARFAGDDAVALVLDTFHDRRNAFVFATNPNGAEYDGLITDESPAFNSEWRRHLGGGGPEDGRGLDGGVRHPLPHPALCRRGEGPQTWGFNVERVIRRKNEQTLWSAWVRGEGGLNRISQRRHPGGPERPPTLAAQPRRQALRPRRADAGATGRRHDPERAPDECRARRQVGGAPRPRPRRHRSTRTSPRWRPTRRSST